MKQAAKRVTLWVTEIRYKPNDDRVGWRLRGTWAVAGEFGVQAAALADKDELVRGMRHAKATYDRVRVRRAR
jgi:hypothetical protein